MYLLLAFLLGIPALIAYLRAIRYFGGQPCRSTVRLDGKVAVVTGANTGIGKEAALELARRGAKVILGCRNLEKGSLAAVDIESSTGQHVKVVALDLEDTDTVHKFAEVVNQEDRLDILVNNAGLMVPVRGKQTKQGFELHMGVNYLGHHLLTHLLYDLLVKSGTKYRPSRIVNVASEGYKFCGKEGLKIDVEDFGLPSWAYTGFGEFYWLYGQTKLAQIYQVRLLQRKAKEEGHNILAMSLHPGFVKTEIARNLRLGYSNYFAVFNEFMMNIFAKTVTEGAQTTIHCCVTDSTLLEGGAHFDNCKPCPVWEQYNDVRKEDLLCSKANKMLGISETLQWSSYQAR